MRYFLLSVFLLFQFEGYSQDEITPYVDFLEKEHLSPQDYILKLFEYNDIVILGERDHRDTTQYTLILDILADERFIENVGHVYTEVGNINVTEQANDLIKGEYNNIKAFNEAFSRYYINENWEPLWENYNRYQFLRGLTDINQTLPYDKKITIGLTDMAFNWEGMTTERYRRFVVEEMNSAYRTRDSIMASNFIHLFEQQEPINGQRKALVITNRPHAVNINVICNQVIVKKQGRYISDVYGDRVKTIALNWYKWMPVDWYERLIPQKRIELSANGKWDAAFEKTGCKAVGFSFEGSPFGNDEYDYPLCNDLKWKEVFDGFIFYRPFYEFAGATGFEGLIDYEMAKEIIKREIIYDKVYGNKGNVLVNQIFRPIVNWKAKKYYGTFHSYPCSNHDEMRVDMDKWLDN